ncbi:MAG: hypothetical protein DRR42_19220 [Gammaproteobacteria bacterium]|nr:MAG: hypothetical protein DRR42_19220 [Gammaproteobacteria bacterium]
MELLLIVLAVIGVFIIASSQRRKSNSRFKSIMEKNNFNPSHIHDENVALELDTKRLVINTVHSGIRLYEPSSIMGWSTGVDIVSENKGSQYLYFIELRVKDPNFPNPKILFGEDYLLREEWNARITTVYNS